MLSKPFGIQYLTIVFALGLFNLHCATSGAKEKIIVFAASSLTDVTDSLFTRYNELNPDIRILKSDAGSSLLARQIESGAEFDVYLSASNMWTNRVDEKGYLATSETIDYTNELVVVRKSSRLSSTETSSVIDVLRSAKNISIGDPAHVPAGMYAQEFLSCIGLWSDVETRVIPTLDVRAALLAVQSGAADAGIVYSTDVINRNTNSLMIEPNCQPAIRYTIGTSKTISSAANDLAAFVKSPANSDVWQHFGFSQLNDASE